MRHQQCGGELKRTLGAGKYKCQACKAIVVVGKPELKRPRKMRGTCPDLDAYDRG